jgi:hypothetical protein
MPQTTPRSITQGTHMASFLPAERIPFNDFSLKAARKRVGAYHNAGGHMQSAMLDTTICEPALSLESCFFFLDSDHDG